MATYVCNHPSGTDLKTKVVRTITPNVPAPGSGATPRPTSGQQWPRPVR